MQAFCVPPSVALCHKAGGMPLDKAKSTSALPRDPPASCGANMPMQSLANAYCNGPSPATVRDFINDTLAGGEAALTAVQALYYAEATCPGAVDDMLHAASSGRVGRHSVGRAQGRACSSRCN